MKKTQSGSISLFKIAKGNHYAHVWYAIRVLHQPNVFLTRMYAVLPKHWIVRSRRSYDWKEQESKLYMIPERTLLSPVES